MYCPDGGRREDGVNVVQAAFGNLGTYDSDDKGESQVEDPQD